MMNSEETSRNNPETCDSSFLRTVHLDESICPHYGKLLAQCVDSEIKEISPGTPIAAALKLFARVTKRFSKYDDVVLRHPDICAVVALGCSESAACDVFMQQKTMQLLHAAKMGKRWERVTRSFKSSVVSAFVMASFAAMVSITRRASDEILDHAMADASRALRQLHRSDWKRMFVLMWCGLPGPIRERARGLHELPPKFETTREYKQACMAFADMVAAA